MAGIAALSIIIGYLLGSIPFAYIAGRLLKRVDMRQVGGGNVGTLNVAREIGVKSGVIVLIADIAKGSIAVLVARWLDLSMTFVLIAGFAAIVGHNWSVFLKFTGGKGAATTLGVLLALVPIEFLIALVIIGIVIIFTSNVTLGLSFGMFFMPLIIWQFGEANILIFYALGLALFLGFRYLPTVRKTWSSAEGRKNILVDKRYKPWQTKRDK